MISAKRIGHVVSWVFCYFLAAVSASLTFIFLGIFFDAVTAGTWSNFHLNRTSILNGALIFAGLALLPTLLYTASTELGGAAPQKRRYVVIGMGASLFPILFFMPVLLAPGPSGSFLTGGFMLLSFALAGVCGGLALYWLRSTWFSFFTIGQPSTGKNK